MDTLVSILRSISLLPEQREHKPDCQVCFRRVFYAPVCGHHTSQVRPHKDLQHPRAHFDNHFQASASARLTSPAYGNKVIPQNEPHLQTRQTRYPDNSPTGRGVTASSSVSDCIDRLITDVIQQDSFEMKLLLLYHTSMPVCQYASQTYTVLYYCTTNYQKTCDTLLPPDLFVTWGFFSRSP